MVDIAVIKKVCPASESIGEKAAYNTDSSTVKGEALAVAWPTDYEQLKGLVKLASRENILLVPRGGGTSLVGGAVPQKAIVVDMSRLNKVKKLFLNDKAVVVQAGVLLDALNKSIAEYDLEFPIDPCSHSSCTIGGMIATNAAGKGFVNRFMRDWVSNITFLDGTGKVFTVDKNEARRFVGTEGCCGIIIEATLNLEKKVNFSTDLFKFADLNSLINKYRELMQDKEVSGIMFINSMAAQFAGLSRHEHLIVRYSSGKGKIDPAEADEIWHRYENLHSILVAAGFPRAEDPIFETGREKFADWIGKQGFPCYGNIAAGSFHPYLKAQEDVDKMSKIVSELKGQMVGEWGVGVLRRRYVPFSVSHSVKELKVKYDPKNILNKGKVI